MAERTPSNDQAAFGVFPQLQRNRSKQDREAAKNVPIDLARGAVAGVLGAPGDIESFLRIPYDYFRAPTMSELVTGDKTSKTYLPTSEDIEKKLPFRSDTPVSKAATGLGILGGGFYTGPGSPLRVVGALPSAIKHGAQEFAKASVAGAPHVVKPSGKGANWLDGQRGSVEAQLGKMKMSDWTTPEQMAEMQKSIDTAKRIMADDPNAQRTVNQMENELATAKRNNAVNSWIDSNLRNYVKNQMATPDDPVRKLAEEGILHMAPYGEQGIVSSRLMNKRMGLGQDPLGMGRSDPARFWERMSDISVDAYPAGSYKHGSLDESLLKDNPWLQKIPDETMIYSGKGLGGDLGFDHIIDVLRQDVREGRIRPEQLNKVSMEQAVRRVHEYDQEMARKMAETQAKVTEGMPIHKEYPEGYKWIELTNPKSVPKDYALPEGMKLDTIDHPRYGLLHTVSDPKGITQIEATNSPEDALLRFYNRKGGEGYKALEDALKYEGDTMGHCVGGYCPDVSAGRSRIYSLRDAKGEPHVTVEVRPNRGQSKYQTDWFSKQPEEIQNKITEQALAEHNLMSGNRTPQEDRFTWGQAFSNAIKSHMGDVPDEIIQIKGKQNAKPKEDYIPYVQDFVKGGKWSDVGDLQNTGLYSSKDVVNYMPESFPMSRNARTLAIGRAKMSGEMPDYMTRAEYEELLKKHAPEDIWLEKPAEPPTEGMKRGGVAISNNPDTMMLAVNNQKLAKGGKVVKFVEDVAPAAMEKLSMMFGNKLPLNMNTAEIENLAKRFPAPSVDRINMNYKDVTKRVPELTEAAQKLQAGELDRETYAKLVQAYKPVMPYDFVPKPATPEEAIGALKEDARATYGVPSKTLEAGHPVGLRLDIPAYTSKGVWVPTVHEQDAGFGAGTKIGHESVASVLNPQFGMSEKAALSIASGKPKGTIATIKGDWNPTNEVEAVAKAQQYLKHPEWRQVGMDPERHSFFYDRETMAPVVNAEEVIQIGPLVLAKNPKYGKPEDFKYAGGGDVHMADGGLSKLLRAAPKSLDEIKALAERIAPQMLGEFVRGDKGTQSVAGKTQKQFAKEKEMVHDIRPTGVQRPLPKPVDIEQLKGNVMIGIPGDPTISGQTLHSLNGIPLESPSPQHGGPLYGLGRDDAFWASGLGAANRVQNLAREAGMQYDAPVLGKYIMMGPESINYAQHYADANLSAIDPSKMTKSQIESFNNLVREGFPYVKNKERYQRVFPAFPGIENPSEAYLHFSIDPELRKHFNALMQMPTVTEKHGLPSGIDVRHAITEPDLRDLETGVTGKSIGRLRPEVTELGLSEHPTYSHDIPGEFMGSSKYPMPYELSFPDTVRAIRENPKQAPHEFGSLKMVGPRQIIDQQMIDEIKQYEEQMKKLTGKKAGGAITGDDLIIEERPL